MTPTFPTTYYATFRMQERDLTIDQVLLYRRTLADRKRPDRVPPVGVTPNRAGWRSVLRPGFGKPKPVAFNAFATLVDGVSDKRRLHNAAKRERRERRAA